MENSECEKLIKGYVDCYNDFDIAGMLEFLSDSVVFENESGGEINARAEGKREFKELAEHAAKLFSSRNQKIARIEANDLVFVAHIAYKATLAADLPNGLNAGQAIELNGKSEFQIEDGKICYIKDIA